MSSMAKGPDSTNQDNFYYLNQQISGDFQLITRISQFTSENMGAEAGIMVRQNLNRNSPFALFVAQPVLGDPKVHIRYRTYTNGNPGRVGDYLGAVQPQPNAWLKVKKEGQILHFYLSGDGESWSYYSSKSIDIQDSYHLGFTQATWSNHLESVTHFNDIQLKIDSDGDGLYDDQELLIGTDPNAKDTDGDGIWDKEEVDLQTVNNDDLGWNTIANLTGDQGTIKRGSWNLSNGIAKSNGLNGALRYNFQTSQSGIHKIAYQIKRITEHPGASNMPIQIRLYLNGEYMGQDKVTKFGEDDWTSRLTPYLSAGNHSIELAWDNVYQHRSIAITNLKADIATASGSLNLSSWTSQVIDSNAGIDRSSSSSQISPFTLEGYGRYRSMMYSTRATQIKKSSGDRWYADIALEEQGETTFSLSFQNGGKVENLSITWEKTNIEDHSSLTLRAGDKLKLGMNGTSQDQVSLTVAGSSYNIAGDAHAIHSFDTPGTHSITATNTQADGSTQTATMQVNVVGLTSPETPVVLQDRIRTLIWNDIPENVQLESQGIYFSQLETEDGQNHFELTRSEVYENSVIIARLGTDGPIIGNLPVPAFWLRSVVDGKLDSTELPDGAEQVSSEILISDLPTDDIRVHIYVFKSGVTLDDGTITRDLYQDDFNQYGQYFYELIRANTVGGATCHNIHIYQGEHYLGKR